MVMSQIILRVVMSAAHVMPQLHDVASAKDEKVWSPNGGLQEDASGTSEHIERNIEADCQSQHVVDGNRIDCCIRLPKSTPSASSKQSNAEEVVIESSLSPGVPQCGSTRGYPCFPRPALPTSDAACPSAECG